MLKKKRWYIKLMNWKYWLFHLLYLPIYFYWVYLSLKARSFLFFSAANPAIESGGMPGESKDRIMKLLPDRYKPVTIFIHSTKKFVNVVLKMKNNGIPFPVATKPDIGERGWKVKKI